MATEAECRPLWTLATNLEKGAESGQLRPALCQQYLQHHHGALFVYALLRWIFQGGPSVVVRKAIDGLEDLRGEVDHEAMCCQEGRLCEAIAWHPRQTRDYVTRHLKVLKHS